ncbi:MAG: DUF433 domain-containing protein [Vicinamibacteria bacterium]|jgi:hypothetical protein|nr:DUF433 domain-containing protein [Vicinamibacteria bacterium]
MCIGSPGGYLAPRAEPSGNSARTDDSSPSKRRRRYGHGDRIREEYPGLTLAQVHAALAYYYDNTAEIEDEFQESLDAAANFEAEKAEVLRELASRR